MNVQETLNQLVELGNRNQEKLLNGAREIEEMLKSFALEIETTPSRLMGKWPSTHAQHGLLLEQIQEQHQLIRELLKTGRAMEKYTQSDSSQEAWNARNEWHKAVLHAYVVEDEYGEGEETDEVRATT